MDNALKYKLFIIVSIFLFFLYHYDKILFVEPKIFSYYTLEGVVISALSLGMIFSVTVYNLSIYIYSKERQYLYYALGQLSVLFFLITLESLFISPFHAIYGIESFRLHALTHLMILLFSMLFIREFLHTNQIKKLDQIISIVIYLALLDIPIVLITSQNIITGFIPIFVPIWLVVSESFRLIKEKNRAYYLFYIGWNLVIITAVLVYSGLGSIIKSDFPFLHIAFSIESILLSLALTYKIKLLQEEKEAQQSLLLQQSRLASMGEMVASIAHQWRQPLTHLSYIFMNIKKNSNDPKVIENKLEEANTQLRYMSKTIDDFRNFYNPSKHKERYDIAHTCENAKAITYHALKNANINITITASQTFTFYGNKNEFEQVILNIINNARDALIAREIQNPSIKINIDKPTVTISDNAGGVEKRYQAKIFEPYFSTKERSDGIGLYIAKTIIEKEMGGILTLKNQNRGSQFIITFNLSQVQSPL